MNIGVVFPQTEIGADPVVVRDYVQTAEGLGYSHLLVYDHVMGESTANRTNWTGPYTSETLLYEPYLLGRQAASGGTSRRPSCLYAQELLQRLRLSRQE